MHTELGITVLVPQDRILNSPRTTTQVRSAAPCLAPKPVLALSSLTLNSPGSPCARLVPSILELIAHPPCSTPCLQEVSTQSGEAAMSSDLAILSAAASQLFECTRDMSREAVVALLSGLRDVRWVARDAYAAHDGCLMEQGSNL